jgi:CBS domain-containing protein
MSQEVPANALHGIAVASSILRQAGGATEPVPGYHGRPLFGRTTMTATVASPAKARLTLQVEMAAEMMSPNPISISADAPVSEAITMLTERGFSAAPVIDEAGRPVGVVSQADILVHEREQPKRLRQTPEYYTRSELAAAAGESLADGFQVEQVDPTPVRDIMTPVVFSVAPDTPARSVVEQIVALRVHRLFVVEPDGALVGVISTTDLLRHLKP